MRLEHVALNVADPRAMAEWYVEHLGMRIVRAVTEPPYTTFLADSSGRSLIELYDHPGAEVPDYAAMHPLELHLAFCVDDIEEARQRLVAAGATQAGDVTTTPTGDQLAYVRDPWHVAIQLAKRSTPLAP